MGSRSRTRARPPSVVQDLDREALRGQGRRPAECILAGRPGKPPIWHERAGGRGAGRHQRASVGGSRFTDPLPALDKGLS